MCLSLCQNHHSSRLSTDWYRWTVEPTALYHHPTFTSHIATYLIPATRTAAIPPYHIIHEPRFRFPTVIWLFSSTLAGLHPQESEGDPADFLSYYSYFSVLQNKRKKTTSRPHHHLNYYHYLSCPQRSSNDIRQVALFATWLFVHLYHYFVFVFAFLLARAPIIMHTTIVFIPMRNKWH